MTDTVRIATAQFRNDDTDLRVSVVKTVTGARHQIPDTPETVSYAVVCEVCGPTGPEPHDQSLADNWAQEHADNCPGLPSRRPAGATGTGTQAEDQPHLAARGHGQNDTDTEAGR